MKTIQELTDEIAELKFQLQIKTDRIDKLQAELDSIRIFDNRDLDTMINEQRCQISYETPHIYPQSSYNEFCAKYKEYRTAVNENKSNAKDYSMTALDLLKQITGNG